MVTNGYYDFRFNIVKVYRPGKKNKKVYRFWRYVLTADKFLGCARIDSASISEDYHVFRVLALYKFFVGKDFSGEIKKEYSPY